MVQGWYQGGISVFDWTDPTHPKEIAYFDRGPMDSTKLVGAGSWSAYWYNGYIISSEIGRGLDVLELLPSGLLSQNEIDAAKLVHFDYLNVQDQPKLVWPPSFAVARAYVDQLVRANGLAPDKVAAVRSASPAAPAFTPADVRFMEGMIGHHAQAVLMAGWAPSHDASAAVRALCERVVVGQRDEIALMQRWLRERHEPVPEADPAHFTMPGMDPSMLMPGM